MNKLHTAILCAAVSTLGSLQAQEAKPAAAAPAEAKQAEAAPTAPPAMDKVSYFIGKNVGGQFAGQKEKVDLAVFLEGVKDAFAGTKPPSYAMGIGLGQQFRSEGIAIDLENLKAGIEFAASGGKTPEKFANADVEAAMDAFNKVMQAKQEARVKADEAREMAERAAGAAGAKAAGAKFLAENGKKKGVTTTASGLQYEVMKEGSGPKPAATDQVKVHYHGTLTNGKVFDSSVERGEPITFPLQGVIKGWTEGVQLMPTGSKFRFFIPSELAYGDTGAGDDIGPGETLIFEVELLGIVK